MKRNIYSLILFSALNSVALASEAAPSAVGQPKVVKPVKAWSNVDSTSVNFIKGGSALSEAETLNLKALYEKSGRNAPVERILVVAWADKEGLKSEDKANASQVSLAQKRAEVIKQLMGDLSNKPVLSYNMAKDAGWIAKTFHTRDAELKDALKFPDAADEQNRALAEILQQQGGLGKAVVILQKEDDNLGNQAAGR